MYVQYIEQDCTVIKRKAQEKLSFQDGGGGGDHLFPKEEIPPFGKWPPPTLATVVLNGTNQVAFSLLKGRGHEIFYLYCLHDRYLFVWAADWSLAGFRFYFWINALTTLMFKLTIIFGGMYCNHLPRIESRYLCYLSSKKWKLQLWNRYEIAKTQQGLFCTAENE